MAVPSLSSWVRVPARRDPLLAAALAVAVLVVSKLDGFSWLEAAGGAAVYIPLAVRTRWPLPVLAAVAGGAVAYVALAAEVSPAFTGSIMVALYTVGLHGTRRRALAVTAAIVPSTIVVVLLFSPEQESTLGQIVGDLSQFGFALAVGEARRSRREAIEAIHDRAERSAHERELEARRRAEEERVRIARDVHDVVAHSIATISTQAAVGAHVGREEPERALDALESIKQVSNRALQDLRHALAALRDPGEAGPAHPTPAVDGVPELVDQARDAGVRVELRMEGAPAELPSGLQVAVYRIVQEGLTNVMRHASGSRAVVRVAVLADEVAVEVANDGGGTPTQSSQAGSHSGLVGMHERASALGGSIQSGAQLDGGFRVRAVLPVDREAV